MIIDDRLIIDFERYAYEYGDVAGLPGYIKDNIPAVIQNKGITAEDWKTWMKML